MFFTLLSVLVLLLGSNGQFPPSQIHINYGSTPDIMVFNWITFDHPIITKSVVKLGLSPQVDALATIVNGDTYEFMDGGSLKTNRTIHVVSISGLKPATTYYYQVGDYINGWSTILTFKSANDAVTLSDNLPQKFVIYGDIGNYNGQILPWVTEEGLNDQIDCVLHAGDFAYNLQDDNSTVGDLQMNDLQTLTSKVPYMVSPGNHEAAYNFSLYTLRFMGMPNPSNTTVWTNNGYQNNNWYYSFNLGLVHIIAISTEIYFDFPWLIKPQYEWLKQDLEIANQNRSRAPWIIVHGHRPFYCSYSASRCVDDADKLRNGVNGSYGLEDLFYKYGVDFYFNGHNHNYERMYDIYKNKSDERVTNMTSTTYVVTGAAGNCENLYHYKNPQPNWSAFRAAQFCYTRFYVYNDTHIHFQQVAGNNSLVKTGPLVIDDVWYKQYKHGGFEKNYGGDLNVISSRKYYIKQHSQFQYSPIDGYDSQECPLQYYENKELHGQNDTFYVPYLGDDKELYRGVPFVHF